MTVLLEKIDQLFVVCATVTSCNMEHTIVICGKGQVLMVLVVNVLLVEQDSPTTQLLES